MISTGHKGARAPSFRSPRTTGARHAAPALLSLALAIGCGQSTGSGTSASATAAPPTERWTEVVTESAPLLVNPAEEFPPPQILHRGELLRVGASKQVASWKGMVEDVEVTRDGMVFQVQRTKDGTASFAFQSDLGGEVTISATSWICAELAKQPLLNTANCSASLQRARTADGAIVSYLPCGTGVCPIALERDGKLASIGVEGLTSAHFVSGKKKSALVIETRFVKENGERTGSTVEIVSLDAAPARAGAFPADEVDARNPDHVVSKTIKVSVTRAEVRLTGKVEEHGPGGTITSTRTIDEKHPLPALD